MSDPQGPMEIYLRRQLERAESWRNSRVDMVTQYQREVDKYDDEIADLLTLIDAAKALGV